jgi:hypothetical protein
VLVTVDSSVMSPRNLTQRADGAAATGGTRAKFYAVRRRRGIIIGFALCVGILAGCGGSAGQPGTKTASSTAASSAAAPTATAFTASEAACAQTFHHVISTAAANSGDDQWIDSFQGAAAGYGDAQVVGDAYLASNTSNCAVTFELPDSAALTTAYFTTGATTSLGPLYTNQQSVGELAPNVQIGVEGRLTPTGSPAPQYIGPPTS